MRLPELEGLSFREIIKGAADYHEHRSGGSVEVAGAPPYFIPSVPMGVAIYRVVTEALNNATLHAGPCRMAIDSESRNGEVRVQVTDSGSGFTPGQVPEGLGIRGMQERIKLLGGTLEIRSSPALGTTVDFRLPMRAL